MPIEFIGELLMVIGKVSVVLAVLHMHSTLITEHRIDHAVVLSYRQERVLTWVGLLLIVIGFALAEHGAHIFSV